MSAPTHQQQNAGAKALGCKLVNIGNQDLLDGNVDLILGLVWQLIRCYLMRNVNLLRCVWVCVCVSRCVLGARASRSCGSGTLA